MKQVKGKIKFTGMLLFFVMIAIIIQIAILSYDFIIKRTTDKLLIAVLILIVIIILSVICTIIDIFRRKIMIDKPVNRILDATERITNGDYNINVVINKEYPKYNEYDLILENINTMASELRKNEVLKTDFISNVSHEIKTPLAIIKNYAGLLQDYTLSEDERKKYSKVLLNATNRLADLITNILKLNKLENQVINLDNQRFNLTESLSEIILSFEDIIENKNINLECDLDQVVVYSASSMIEIIINNLISNAIKFTESNGTIKVSLKCHNKDVIIRVSDTGCGISPEVGERIFEKFYQADSSHKQEGNGLGLALVKKVIDILGGEIAVESEICKGSTFKIILKNIIVD